MALPARGGRRPRAGADRRIDRDAGPPDVDADPVEVARAICLRLLTGAPRTRAQLAEALRRRGVPGSAAEEVLGRLTEVGLIDDRAFADAWVSSRHSGRGLGRRALSAELRARGVDEAVVSEAVDALDPDAEIVAARALVARKLSATEGRPAAVRMRRLVAMLQRRGYSGPLAIRVVREALATDSGSAGPGEPVDDGLLAAPDDGPV